MKPFEVFTTGTHTDSKGREVVITADDLSYIASNFNAQSAGAPLVVGHPKADAPAYGWAEKFTVEGENLIAHPAQVEAQFSQMVQDGRFKNRSISLYGPADPANPVPGGYYPRHIGFLGAQAPAISGLKAVEFSAAKDAYEFQSPLESAEDVLSAVQWIISGVRRLFSVPGMGRALASEFSTPEPQEDIMHKTTKTTAAAAALLASPAAAAAQGVDFSQSDLDAQRKKLEADRHEFAQILAATRRAEDLVLVEALETAGKVTPALKSGMVEFMAALPHDAPFEFAQADGEKVSKSPRDYFRELIGGASPLINFSAVSVDDGEGADDAGSSKTAQDLAADAVAFQKQQADAGVTISIPQAVAQVSNQNKTAA